MALGIVNSQINDENIKIIFLKNQIINHILLPMFYFFIISHLQCRHPTFLPNFAKFDMQIFENEYLFYRLMSMFRLPIKTSFNPRISQSSITMTVFSFLCLERVKQKVQLKKEFMFIIQVFMGLDFPSNLYFIKSSSNGIVFIFKNSNSTILKARIRFSRHAVSSRNFSFILNVVCVNSFNSTLNVCYLIAGSLTYSQTSSPPSLASQGSSCSYCTRLSAFSALSLGQFR